MLQHIVSLQNIRRRELYALHIAASQFQVAVFAVRNQQSRLGVVQLAQRQLQRLGFVRLESPAIHDRQFLLRKLRRKRGAQRAQQHFLWQSVTVIARLRSVNRASMAPKRRPDGANTSAASAFLPPKFAACAADLALVLGLVSAGALAVQIPSRRFMQQIAIHLRAKDRVRQFELADLLALQIHYVDYRHNSLPYNFGYFALRALRIKMYEPCGPGTEPRTSSRFSSVSTCTTLRFLAVTRSLPMCPGKC